MQGKRIKVKALDVLDALPAVPGQLTELLIIYPYLSVVVKFYFPRIFKVRSLGEIMAASLRQHCYKATLSSLGTHFNAA